MISILASIPLMLLAVVVATLPVLLAMRNGRYQANAEMARQARPVAVRLDPDARSPVRSAA